MTSVQQWVGSWCVFFPPCKLSIISPHLSVILCLPASPSCELSFSISSSCPLPLPTSLHFLFFLFFLLLLYVNADRCVQDTEWHLWIMLSPICVMELKGCFLCLEYDMLSRAIWIHCLWLGAQQGASDYPFVFVGTKHQRVNFFKRNWSAVANHVLLPRLPFLLQSALFTDCHTHLIPCSLYVYPWEGVPCVDPHFSASERPL